MCNQIKIVLFFILAGTSVFAQNETTNTKKWEVTKTGIGIYPAIEASHTPRNLGTGVFAPDITFAYKDNVFGFGPRVLLVNTDNYSNSKTTSKENAYGAGLNYRLYITNHYSPFDWFIYYDMEYFHYNYAGTTINPNSTTELNNVKADNYNFISGVGYHINLFKHLYFCNMAGIGIGLEVGKENIPSSDITLTTAPGVHDYSHKSMSGQFKIGLGYVF